jgi:hypothetical protein
MKSKKIHSIAMKAAWTIWRKGDAGTWSQAMTKAWAWAKKQSESKVLNISKVIVMKESPKALALKVRVACPHLEIEKFGMVWVPKSMISGGTIPKWLSDKKLEEAAEFYGNGYHGRLDVRFVAN